MISDKFEAILGADGAAQGAQGYMQVLGGLRRRLSVDSVSVYGETSIGFGGGGQVDTGAGLFGKVGGGLACPLSKHFDIELSMAYKHSVSGDVSAIIPSLHLTRVFERAKFEQRHKQEWRFATGLTLHVANSDFRMSGSGRTASPIMNETSFDLLLGNQWYLAGNAQTVMGGDAAGFAVGMLGIGYDVHLAENWILSPECSLGAAGGGSVETKGGMIYAYGLDLDYYFRPRLAFSVGAGQMRTVRGGGMAPVSLKMGIKIPFSL